MHLVGFIARTISSFRYELALATCFSNCFQSLLGNCNQRNVLGNVRRFTLQFTGEWNLGCRWKHFRYGEVAFCLKPQLWPWLHHTRLYFLLITGCCALDRGPLVTGYV